MARDHFTWRLDRCVLVYLRYSTSTVTSQNIHVWHLDIGSYRQNDVKEDLRRPNNVITSSSDGGHSGVNSIIFATNGRDAQPHSRDQPNFASLRTYVLRIRRIIIAPVANPLRRNIPTYLLRRFDVIESRDRKISKLSIELHLHRKWIYNASFTHRNSAIYLARL